MTTDNKPLFRGVFHLLVVIGYLLWIPNLIKKIPSELEIPLILYLFAIISNFSASCLLHLVEWNSTLSLYVQRLDHVMIFVKIAATYYAAISTVMTDISQPVLYILLFGISLGIFLRIFFTRIPNILIGLPYILISWSLLLDPYIVLSLYHRIPTGFYISLLAGLSYTIGGFIYMMKYPNPLPKYIGFHEIFHIFTIIGAILFTVAIFDHALPYYLLHNGISDIYCYY